MLLSFGLYRISNFIEYKKYLPVLLLVLLNPLVWAFSGRATADFLPMALGIFAISLALGQRYPIISVLAAGLLLGFAAILKYHTLCLILFLVAILWGRKFQKESLIKVSIVAAVAVFMVGFYLINIHSLFGYWVTPEKFQTTHQLKLYELVNNFILYMGFLALLVLPSAIVSFDYRRYILVYWRLLIPSLVILMIFAFYGLQDVGELNFGPLDGFIGKPLRVLLLSLMSLSAFVLIFMSTSRQNNKDRCSLLIGIALILVVLVFSLSRPSQRYLLFTIPFLLLALPLKVIESRVVLFTTLALFIITNIFVEYSRYCTGTAAALMVEKIERAGLLSATEPGVMEAHVGNHFYLQEKSNKTYLVVSGRNDRSIITAEVGISRFKKSYSLIPLAANNSSQVNLN